jgi:hypothetical protein
MSVKSALKPDVRAELWHSFAVLLKSYAAAATVSGLEHGVLVLTPTSLNIVAASSTLSVGYYAALGRGVWSVITRGKQELGNFELHHDGSVSLDGAPFDMDHAAIHLIGLLTSAAKLDTVEVLA